MAMYEERGRGEPPVINIDYSRCTVPLDCKKCVTICPQQIFRILTVKVERFKEANPKEPGVYKLVAQHKYDCSGCNLCIDVCSEEAIKINFS